jgi:hypothetical protein
LTIDGPSHARVGTYMTTTGTLGSGITGPVTVKGRWGTGDWRLLASSYARDGRYSVRYGLLRRGTVHIRVALPDGNHGVATIEVS